MKIVDIDKLFSIREMIDCDIAEWSISRDVAIPAATMMYAEQELDVRLSVQRGWGSPWWSCLAMPMSACVKREGKVRTPDIEPKKIAEFFVARTFVARTPYDAAIASLCYEIDSTQDFVLSPEEFLSVYGQGEISKVVEACPLQMRGVELEPTQLLFESEKEYASRLTAICVYYETLLCGYQQFEL